MKVAILIDGGYLKKALEFVYPEFQLDSKESLSDDERNTLNQRMADLVEKFAFNCSGSEEETIWRIFYYDCPFLERDKEAKLPISKASKLFKTRNEIIPLLATKKLFAVRKGILKFRGWKLRNDFPTDRALEDTDFVPIFSQKGVDMRIGLDVATLSTKKSVDRIILVSSDTDMIPAMKHARIEGLQVFMVRVKNYYRNFHPNLLEHADLIREVKI